MTEAASPGEGDRARDGSGVGKLGNLRCGDGVGTDTGSMRIGGACAHVPAWDVIVKIVLEKLLPIWALCFCRTGRGAP
jgi:hypothetical protein